MQKRTISMMGRDWETTPRAPRKRRQVETGLSYYEATAWRRQATKHLGRLGITTYDPTALPEAIEALGECDEYPALCEIDPRLAGRIMRANRRALATCRAMIALASVISRGTRAEVELVAGLLCVPVIAIGAAYDGVDIVVPTVAAACEVAAGYLLPLGAANDGS